jgi:general secretion pathway protein D
MFTRKAMIFKSFNRKAALTSLFALSAFLPMSACDLANNFTKLDRSTNSEMQDYRDAMAPREIPGADASADSKGVPEVQSYVADDSQGLKSAPLVSLSINQSIPLREALFELSKQADYDIELDPRISGSIIFTARNRPLDEVIDRICEISGLRYKFDNNTIRIELDTPYSKNYKVDFLNIVRSNGSTMNTDVSLSSSGDAKSGGGSKFDISSKSEGDFWGELDANLKQILASNASPGYLKTNEDPAISLTSSGPVTPPVPPIDASALSSTAPQAGTEDYVSSPVSLPSDTALASSSAAAGAATPTAPSSTTTTTTTTTANPPPVAAATPAAASTNASADTSAAPQALTSKPVVPAQAPVLKVESLPTAASTGTSVGGANAVQFTPAYSINKQAGIISVYANQRLHKQVASYLEDLRRTSTSQVLIEAKVLEVTLSDEFSAGINWALLDGVGDFTISSKTLKPTFSPASTSEFTFGFSGSDLTTSVSALSRFGTVHALASPRLSVLNNQSAVLNVAKNQVYFEIKSTVTPATTTSGQTTSFDATIKSVPEGVMINVLPSIDLDRRTIAMQVRPTITKIEYYVSDPTIALNTNITTVQNLIPVMNVQETDSVLNLRDKQMMVMGGLLQDSTISSQDGIPVAGEIPVLGGLFRNQGDKVSKKELVVFIKATILDNPGDSIHQTDKDLYRVFSQDRRPDKL